MIAEYLIKFDEEIKSCDVCPFCKTNDDLDSEDYRHMYCGYPQMGEFVTDYIACRHPDCPLKEVPPHGRLGDLDKVAGRMHNNSKSCRKNGNIETAEIWEHAEQEVRLQGTVIEASN